MSLFDSLKDSASGLIGSEAHTALNDALEKSSLGDVSGLLDKLHEGGLDGAVEAWSVGEDHPHVGPDQLREALGDEHVQHLADSMGVSTDQLLTGLSEHLPALAAHDAGDDADEEDDDNQHDDDQDDDDTDDDDTDDEDHDSDAADTRVSDADGPEEAEDIHEN